MDGLVFVSRRHTTPQGQVLATRGFASAFESQSYIPGARLLYLRPARQDGNLRNLTEAFPEADIESADISFDASEVVFSMKQNADDRYHLYTASLAPPFEIHQKTAGPEDDVSPRYVSESTIAFVTNAMAFEMGTRTDESGVSRNVTQLAIISRERGDADRRTLTAHLSHVATPFARRDGRIGFTRWDHVGPKSAGALYSVMPDGTDLRAFAGAHGSPYSFLLGAREVGPNTVAGIGTMRTRTFGAGPIVRVDARKLDDPACENDPNVRCIREDSATFTKVTPGVSATHAPTASGRYRDLFPVGDKFLASFADGPVSDIADRTLTPPDFGIVLVDETTGHNQLLYNDRETWELSPLAVSKRSPPFDLPHTQPGDAPVRVIGASLAETTLSETIGPSEASLSEALREAVAVRFVEGFSGESRRDPSGLPTPSFGLTPYEGGALLGEVPLLADGSYHAEIPANIPLRLMAIDKFGMSIRSEMIWSSGAPGEVKRCTGCHGAPEPRESIAERTPPTAIHPPLSNRVELAWQSDVQPVLNVCETCHNSTTSPTYSIGPTYPDGGPVYELPVLDLSQRPVTAYADARFPALPASYVSLLFASVLAATKTPTSRGTPTPWILPGSARRSPLMAKVNVRAPDGTLAFPGPLHPEDKGTPLSDAQRRTLVLMADLGATFFSRGPGFVPLPPGSP